MSFLVLSVKSVLISWRQYEETGERIFIPVLFSFRWLGLYQFRSTFLLVGAEYRISSAVWIYSYWLGAGLGEGGSMIENIKYWLVRKLLNLCSAWLSPSVCAMQDGGRKWQFNNNWTQPTSDHDKTEIL